MTASPTVNSTHGKSISFNICEIEIFLPDQEICQSMLLGGNDTSFIFILLMLFPCHISSRRAICDISVVCLLPQIMINRIKRDDLTLSDKFYSKIYGVDQRKNTLFEYCPRGRNSIRTYRKIKCAKGHNPIPPFPSRGCGNDQKVTSIFHIYTRWKILFRNRTIQYSCYSQFRKAIYLVINHIQKFLYTRLRGI